MTSTTRCVVSVKGWEYCSVEPVRPTWLAKSTPEAPDLQSIFAPLLVAQPCLTEQIENLIENFW